jgi:hypothetical protein
MVVFGFVRIAGLFHSACNAASAAAAPASPPAFVSMVNAHVAGPR